jgi:uncharacterized repeat protein (TIGR03803 family)
MTRDLQKEALVAVRKLCRRMPAQAVVLAAVGITALWAAQPESSTVLHNFSSFARGEMPYAGVVRDAQGNLYGTTLEGPIGGESGPFNGGPGVVYKVDTTGHETVLHRFSGRNGLRPFGGVILDSAGNLYGTALYGGFVCGRSSSGCGLVFKLNSSGQETVLYNFSGSDGESPYAGLTMDAAGNIYGTTSGGGSKGLGVVYKINTAGHERVLHNFKGADGRSPYAGVTLDAAGNLYGTTLHGGARGYGVVYKLNPSGHETVLYSFTGGADGGSPEAGVILDAAGNLYGTTGYGGLTPGDDGCGVVFKLDTAGHETVLHAFTGSDDGCSPTGGVTLDSAGNLYGTTTIGGTANKGVVFKLDASGNETVLYSFQGLQGGSFPDAGVILDSAGNLYGTASGGGAAEGGVVYKINTAGQQTVVYSFPAGAGAFPNAGVTLDATGNLYGTTTTGGTWNAGAVYKMNPSGREIVLYSFTGGADGGTPQSGVVFDAEGNLYGTTVNGGSATLPSCAGPSGQQGCGVVYKIDPSGRETVLHSFTGGADGGSPYDAGVVLDAAGNLYGATSYGGILGQGVVFKLDATGQETVLYTFTGGADGGQPNGVIRDSAGNLYGTTYSGGTGNCGACGVVYKLDTAGQQTVLHTFMGPSDGWDVEANVTMDAEGNLYGTAVQGGAYDNGVVYKIDPSGQETILFSFGQGSNPSSGCDPYGGVILDAAGNLYGTTGYCGGPNYVGTVYKLDPAGNETVLHAFNITDGMTPYAGVTMDASGDLFGTTYYGGSTGAGVVFELKPAAAVR